MAFSSQRLLCRNLPTVNLFIFFAAVGLGFPTAGFAIDWNDNGLSDVWEALYPIPAGQEEEDSDLDGHTHRQESEAGLNPFSYASRLKLELVPRPSLGTLDIAFDTVRGHSYQVEWRQLPEPSWQPAGTVVTSATGGVMTVSVPMPLEAGRATIFRYRLVGAVFSDSDALSDWEEFQLGTDANALDTDGDGLEDGFEFGHAALGLNPLDAYALDPTRRVLDGLMDSDGDGWSNADEVARSANPFSPELPPPSGPALTVFTPLE